MKKNHAPPLPPLATIAMCRIAPLFVKNNLSEPGGRYSHIQTLFTNVDMIPCTPVVDSTTSVNLLMAEKHLTVTGKLLMSCSSAIIAVEPLIHERLYSWNNAIV